MTDLSQDVNNISSKVLLFLNVKKFRVVSATSYQCNKKIYEAKDVANEYCNAHKDASLYNTAYMFLVDYCVKEYRRQADDEAKKSESDIPDYGFYDVKRARMRSRQLYFCDNPASPGHILTPTADGYHVSEDKHSLHVFKRDLMFFGEEAYAEWCAKNLIVGSDAYDPWGPTLSENSSGVYILNTYRKPLWAEEKKTRKWEELYPEIRCFYRYLFPIKEHMRYALNWLVCTVKLRYTNQKKAKLSTYLTLIGASGVGKGIFLERHAAYFHGRSNFFCETQETIASRFATSAYQHKTLLVFNETEIGSRTDYNAIKSFESEYLNVEVKQQTAKMQRTFFNVAFSLNPLSGLRYVKDDDRRFSIPDINTTPIIGQKMIDEETGEEILFDFDMLERLASSDEILQQVAEYLLGLTPDFKLAEKPLKETVRYKEVMAASRSAWVRELVESLNEIDFENAGGTLDQLGYKEIMKTTDLQDYYTYEIDVEKMMRMAKSNTTTRRTPMASKSKIIEELRKLPKDEMHCYFRDGFCRGVRIRHKDHDEIRQKMKEKFIT